MFKKSINFLFDAIAQSKIFLTIVLFSLTCNSLSSQLNIKMGYTLDYGSHETNNLILDAYNSNNQWLSQEFKPVRLLNGLQAGLRYKKDFMAFDVSFERVFGGKESFGINNNGVSVSNELKYTLSRYALGLEVYNNMLGIGANVYHEIYTIKSPISGIDSDEKITSDGNFGNKIYLIFSSQGNGRISVSLQPFVMIPWSDSNLFNLNTYLGNDNNLQSYNQRNLQFGISLIFYNGPQ
jgi:hypothetical protein